MQNSEGVNEQFHSLYDAARGREVLDVPVLVVLQDKLVLVHRGTRRESLYTSAAFRLIKTVAHVPVAIFAASHAGRLEPAHLATFTSALPPLRASLAEEPALLTPPAALASLLALLAEIEMFLRRGVEAGKDDTAALADFARTTGPRLLECTRHATRLQLAALHGHTRRLLGALDPSERGRLEVVVAGAHQARVRSMAMQYFEQLLEEAPSAEVRLVYAEGVADVDGALALVGTRKIDRAIARAFFGDERRLQRDILGDAAKEQLHEVLVTPLR